MRGWRLRPNENGGGDCLVLRACFIEQEGQSGQVGITIRQRGGELQTGCEVVKHPVDQAMG
jgi:hypothetical protein